MIVRLALPGALVDMSQNAEAEFRVLVEDLAFGHLVAEMGGDESIVLQCLLDQRADLLAALDPGIVL